MQENPVYKIYCKSCKITYHSGIPAIIGQPCPNINCPRNNPIISQVWWERKWVRVAAIGGGLAFLTVLAFDLGGWGAFFLDLVISFLVQTAIALVLFGMLLAIFLIAFGKALKPFMSRHVLLGIFLLAVVLSLPLVAVVFQRRLDIYDVAITVILGIAANLLTKPLERLLEK